MLESLDVNQTSEPYCQDDLILSDMRLTLMSAKQSTAANVRLKYHLFKYVNKIELRKQVISNSFKRMCAINWKACAIFGSYFREALFRNVCIK